MLQNAYLLAKIGADTAENERHFAEICQKLATTLRVAGDADDAILAVALHPGTTDTGLSAPFQRGVRAFSR